MSKSEMSDLPPEVLEVIFNATDLATKKEIRLACKTWHQIVDNSQVVNFCVRNMRTLAHLNTFLDSTVKEFSLVKMAFTWGVKFPKYLLKEGFNFNTHTIKELVFAKPSYKRNTAQPHTIGDSHVLKFFINFMKSGCHGVKHLNIHSEIMVNFIVSDLERALSSSVQWNTVQKLSLAESIRRSDGETHPEFGFPTLKAILKFVNIPNLNDVKIAVGPCWYTLNEDIHRFALIALVVDICKFFLRYKQTLRHVFLVFGYSLSELDLEKHLAFMDEEGPLQLESFVLEVGNAESDALGHIATACTKGPTKLRTFGYSSCNNRILVTPAQINIANERLERILSQHGPTIEDLTLDMHEVNFNLLRHCTKLKTLKFGDVGVMDVKESSSNFPNITRLKVQTECYMKPEFFNRFLEHCPNLVFLEIREFCNTCNFFLKNQTSLLKFEKLSEILLFGDPYKFTRLEVQLDPEFKCVRKIHPSTSVPYLSIVVQNHNL